MRKFFFLLLFIAPLDSFSYSQITKLRGETMVTQKMTNGYWDDWTEGTKINAVITVNPDNDRVTIFGADLTLSFDIIKEKGTYLDSGGDKNYEMICIDNYGEKCTVTLIVPTKYSGTEYLVIVYPDFKIFISMIFISKS